MEVAYKFALSGENMDFISYRIRDGHLTPPSLFIDIMVEKCQLINHHFCNTRDHLKVVASVMNTTATVKFHDTLLVDSELKIVVISNTSDLEKQLRHLWTEVQKLLKYYHEDDRIAELASIETYYRNFAYNRMLAQFFNFEFFLVLYTS